MTTRRRKVFTDVTNIPGMGLELLMKQRRYRDAVALCSTNKAVQLVCKSDMGRKILRRLEAEESLESFVTIHVLNASLIYSPVGSDTGVPLETDNMGGGPGWDRFLKDRRISSRLYGILNDKAGHGAHNWASAFVEASSDHPISLVLEKEYRSGVETPILDLMARDLFEWEESSPISPGELLQLLDITIVGNHAFEVSVDYDRWMQFFQRGMSKDIHVFKEGVWGQQ